METANVGPPLEAGRRRELGRQIRFDLQLLNMAVDMSEVVTGEHVRTHARTRPPSPSRARLSEEIKKTFPAKSAHAVAKGHG